MAEVADGAPQAEDGRGRLRLDRPLVSVGVPTRNGGRYLRDSLSCLLAQDYPHLEVVILDNASTDDVPAIAEEFVRTDPRVRYVRHPTNIGAVDNFNRAVHATSGKYFMWAADDDRWAPSYVRRCLDALEREPAAVMATSRLHFIDEIGRDLGLPDGGYDNPDLSSPDVAYRLRTLFGRSGWYLVYGLIRRQALLRTTLLRSAYGADVLLAAQLALLGPILLVDERLFSYRQFAQRSEEERLRRLDSPVPIAAILEARYTGLHRNASRLIRDARVRPVTKLRCHGALLRAGYLDPTPLRASIRRELRPALRAALGERDPIDVTRELLFAGVCVTAEAGSRLRRWASRHE